MNENGQSQITDDTAEAHKRKMAEALTAMKIFWPLTVVLIGYLKFIAEKGATLTHILALVLALCLIAAMGWTYSFFGHRKRYRELTGQAAGQE